METESSPRAVDASVKVNGAVELVNPELGERFLQLCRMTDEMMKRMSPCDRDRMLQEHFAATRSPASKFQLLCRMTDAFAFVRRERMRKLRETHE